MPTKAEAYRTLQLLFEDGTHRIKQRDTYRSQFISTPSDDENLDYYNESVAQWMNKLMAYIDEMVRRPHYHHKHFENLKVFCPNAEAYERSVFIMTKFPEGTTQLDEELQAVIDTVKNSITDCGYQPRIAQTRYAPLLWENVELHLLGCSKGVAIVEDKYRNELNPNVAMEWGWMVGMGKDVLYLEEESFKQARADWSGLITDRFAWDKPKEKIPTAIKKWLEGPRRS